MKHAHPRAGELLLIQDRTSEDVFLPGLPEHMRGWFFDLFPSLAAIERASARAPPIAPALAADLRGRTGRSILYELSYEALGQMIAYILARVAAGQLIVENDLWTFWWVQKPDVAGNSL